MTQPVPSRSARPSIGDHLRDWRQRRRMSQMDLALDAEVSTRHLSFVETGRAAPSREMILKLAERLDIPLRERNVLLVAGGFAPVFPERSLDDPAVVAARRAIDIVLAGHEPYPAVALDRHWTLMAHNRAITPFLEGCDAALLAPPVNMLRLALHPKGIAPRIDNPAEVRAHLTARLRRQIEVSADPVLAALLAEILSYPVPFAPPHPGRGREAEDLFVPVRLRSSAGPLTLISATTMFGTPVDVTLAELAIETFLPADAETAERLRAMMG
ncbi:helix-turn-helix domain-containing protein [Phreatobacter sp.]|uniref:helix-turn-helix domain-containing protein n=1 Tax=Phreatobacter sp. TaxID=1966341 RepID=UPI003F6F90EB